MWEAITAALTLEGAPNPLFEDVGPLPSAFAVEDLAATSIGAVGAACGDFLYRAGVRPCPRVRVNRRLAALWFEGSVTPMGWELPPVWDSIAGVYGARDGFIRIHTNLPHHKAAVLSALCVADDPEAVAGAVATWGASALEEAIIARGGCAAANRTEAAWRAHPQGRAVAAEPLITWDHAAPVVSAAERPAADVPRNRPLAGVKVLDLTRVLAGPVCTRTLAGFGAEVLRIDPPDWAEDNVEPEVTLGKRCARLDLKSPNGLRQLRALLSEADIFVHGYRPGALDALGLGADIRRTLNPALVDVSLCAYGWTGPWARRRGFDSLVQMSTGLASTGADWAGTVSPSPLPVQALDHATGYLMAAAAIKAWSDLRFLGRASGARLSLARTAALLSAHPMASEGEKLTPAPRDQLPRTEITPWGPAQRLRAPVAVGEIELAWDRAATRFGSDPAHFGPAPN